MGIALVAAMAFSFLFAQAQPMEQQADTGASTVLVVADGGGSNQPGGGG